MHRSLVALALVAVGCSGSGTPAADAQPRDLASVDRSLVDGRKPPILTSSHAGWKQPGCEACHKLPEKGHLASRPPECAACHGGNGACDPNGASSTRKGHAKTDDCLGCHGKKHGSSAAADCVSCHLAATAGVVDCPAGADAGPGPDLGAKKEAGAQLDGGGPPKLSTAVKTSCYNWPAQEFTTTNKAPWANQVLTGALAVELTLKDLNGTPTTLSSLLASKPVWLQLGAFT